MARVMLSERLAMFSLSTRRCRSASSRFFRLSSSMRFWSASSISETRFSSRFMRSVQLAITAASTTIAAAHAISAPYTRRN